MFGDEEDSGKLRLRTPALDVEHFGDPLSRLLKETDSMSEGCAEEQTRAYNLLKSDENEVCGSPHMSAYIHIYCTNNIYYSYNHI